MNKTPNFGFIEKQTPELIQFIEAEWKRITPYLPGIIKHLYELNWHPHIVDNDSPCIWLDFGFKRGFHSEDKDIFGRNVYRVYRFVFGTDSDETFWVCINQRSSLEEEKGIVDVEFLFSDWIKV